jgi:hypothetical protein
MGYKNRVGDQGFVTEDKGEEFNTTFVLEKHTGHSEQNYLFVLPDGTVQVKSGSFNLTGSFSGSFVGNFSGSYNGVSYPIGGTISGTLDGLANSVKFQFSEHSGTQLIPDVSYAPMKINGIHDSVNGGLNLWNTVTNVFKPTTINSVYTLRVTGKTAPTGGSGNQIIHLSFLLSGSDPHAYNGRNGQEYEVGARSGLDHVHLHAMFTCFSDQDLVTSGAQIYMTTTINSGIELLSCSIFIKEG